MIENKTNEKFKTWTKNKQFSLLDLFPRVQKNEIYHLDLSINNLTVKTEEEFNNPDFFEQKIKEIQQKNPSKIIAGGYLEKRSLYTSNIYNSTTEEKRNIHLGIDFWLPKNTLVSSLLDGEIISSVYQKSYKGYGGFIILKHTFKDIEFYTLYGHLSKISIDKNTVGKSIKKGETIGYLGNYFENGKWVPHLHFQIILTLLEYKNDFPGVARESEIENWKMICPDPNLLFKLDILDR